MNDQMIARINELYNKSKNEGLNEKEKIEQQELRSAYVLAMRSNLRSHLNSITVVDEEGNRTNLGEKYGNNKDAK